MRTLLRHGTIVNADGQHRADVLVDGERIAEVGAGLRRIARSGRSTRPAGSSCPAAWTSTPTSTCRRRLRTADDFEAGTIAAACGGTTTVVDYATQAKGGTLREALDAWMARADGRRGRRLRLPHRASPTSGLTSRPRSTAMVAAGVPSFKVFMAYPGA